MGLQVSRSRRSSALKPILPPDLQHDAGSHFEDSMSSSIQVSPDGGDNDKITPGSRVIVGFERCAKRAITSACSKVTRFLGSHPLLPLMCWHVHVRGLSQEGVEAAPLEPDKV